MAFGRAGTISLDLSRRAPGCIPTGECQPPLAGELPDGFGQSVWASCLTTKLLALGNETPFYMAAVLTKKQQQLPGVSNPWEVWALFVAWSVRARVVTMYGPPF